MIDDVLPLVPCDKCPLKEQCPQTQCVAAQRLSDMRGMRDKLKKRSQEVGSPLAAWLGHESPEVIAVGKELEAQWKELDELIKEAKSATPG